MAAVAKRAAYKKVSATKRPMRFATAPRKAENRFRPPNRRNKFQERNARK
jgi:hypothetical protein